jgi:D-amino-acid dehydrogenase
MFMRAVIVGAGIVGIQSAHALMDLGHEATLVDPDGLAQRTSRGNAGYIAHTDILPLASPKVWRHLPRWLLDPLGPLSIRPSYALAILPWMARFVAASTPSRIEASTQGMIALNGLSLAAWERRLALLGLADAHLRRKGYLLMFPAASGLAANMAMIRRQQSLGIAAEVLADNAAVRRLEPAFSKAAAAAVFYPGGVSVDDPASITTAVGEAALARGAKLVRQSVTEVRPVDGGVRVRLGDGSELSIDLAVIAAGAWSRPLAKALGDDVPLDTERGYNVTLPKGALGLTRPVLFDGLGFVTTPLDGGDRIGGAVEFAGLDAPPNYKRVDAIIARARPFLPDAKFEGGTRWMGFRPSLPDSLPVIDRATASPRIVYAFGHGHFGLTQSAATGEIVAALLTQRPVGIDLAAFSCRRF